MKSIREFFKKLFGVSSTYEEKPISHVSSEDEDFVTDSKSALLNQGSPWGNAILIAILVLAVIGIIWAALSTVEQVSVGEGKVIPSSYVKLIQSLDGGIVSELYVHEGELVKKNQVLMRLDPTRYKGDYEANYIKHLVLSATVARLNAEAADAEKIDFPKSVLEHPEMVARENKLFNTRRESLKSELQLLEKSYVTSKKQLEMYEQLLPKGYTSKVEYFRILQYSLDTHRRMIERKGEYYEQVNKDLTDFRGQLESLDEQIHTLKDKLMRTTIVSPVNGVVKKINVTTIGGVVTPGQDIMEIVPMDDTLLVEAYINPINIAFIHIGQAATVKITAYDFSIYGSLHGKVEYISADTMKQERTERAPSTNPQEKPFYIVKIRTNKNYLGSEKHKLVILPGMTATVHIKTGEKTILQYFLKPLIKAKEEALRER